MLNTGGATVSERGYVCCRICGREEQGISKETSLAYALCMSCKSQTARGADVSTRKAAS